MFHQFGNALTFATRNFCSDSRQDLVTALHNDATLCLQANHTNVARKWSNWRNDTKLQWNEWFAVQFASKWGLAHPCQHQPNHAKPYWTHEKHHQIQPNTCKEDDLYVLKQGHIFSIANRAWNKFFCQFLCSIRVFPLVRVTLKRNNYRAEWRWWTKIAWKWREWFKDLPAKIWLKKSNQKHF